MGWICQQKGKSESIVQYLRRCTDYHVNATWPGLAPGQEYTVLALKAGRGGAFGLLQLSDESLGTELRLAVVIRVLTRAGRTYYQVKSECEGPELVHVPEKLLKQLSPIDALPFSEEGRSRSRDWRARCQKVIDNRAALQPGIRFTVPQGLAFGPECNVTEFEVENASVRLFVANPGTAQQFRCQFAMDSLDALEFTLHS